MALLCNFRLGKWTREKREGQFGGAVKDSVLSGIVMLIREEVRNALKWIGKASFLWRDWKQRWSIWVLLTVHNSPQNWCAHIYYLFSSSTIGLRQDWGKEIRRWQSSHTTSNQIIRMFPQMRRKSLLLSVCSLKELQVETFPFTFMLTLLYWSTSKQRNIVQPQKPTMGHFHGLRGNVNIFAPTAAEHGAWPIHNLLAHRTRLKFVLTSGWWSHSPNSVLVQVRRWTEALWRQRALLHFMTR